MAVAKNARLILVAKTAKTKEVIVKAIPTAVLRIMDQNVTETRAEADMDLREKRDPPQVITRKVVANLSLTGPPDARTMMAGMVAATAPTLEMKSLVDMAEVAKKSAAPLAMAGRVNPMVVVVRRLMALRKGKPRTPAGTKSVQSDRVVTVNRANTAPTLATGARSNPTSSRGKSVLTEKNRLVTVVEVTRNILVVKSRVLDIVVVQRKEATEVEEKTEATGEVVKVEAMVEAAKVAVTASRKSLAEGGINMSRARRLSVRKG